MEATFLLGLTCLCSPLTALVLDFNTIRGSAEVSGSRKGTQCSTDKDCRVGKYCYKPQEEQLPFCAPCQGLRRRCQGNGMCCPGTICINEVCAQVERMPLAEEQRDGRHADLSAKERWPRPAQASHVRKEGPRPKPRSPGKRGSRRVSCKHVRERGSRRIRRVFKDRSFMEGSLDFFNLKPSCYRKAQLGEGCKSGGGVLSCGGNSRATAHSGETPEPSLPLLTAGMGERCLRTSDCSQGHCCARHFWAKICKPVLPEGAVCSGRGQKDGGMPSPEIFQRCGCAPGLVCQRPIWGAPQRARLRVCRSN
ncbi:dickkopf-related protein 4 [Thamnophis elegans]|uniref:dickkopf-related protein 4 n=1 Tax=Thamnophis elegans TaxID=35005 RepID=UPI001376CB13|nr:dickkopf-related protein 4 [Thamnophis elegans]